MNTPRHELARSYENMVDKKTVCWERTGNGWVTRPTTKEDKERWKEIAKELRTGTHKTFI